MPIGLQRLGRFWSNTLMKCSGEKSPVVRLAGGAALLAAVAAAAAIALLGDRTGNGPAPDQAGSRPSGGYDLAAFRQVDPALVLYEEASQPVQTGLNTPTGLFVDAQDRIYVAGDHEVRVLDAQGRLVRRVAVEDAPRTLAVAEDATAFVVSRGRVSVYGGDGKLQGHWDSPGPRTFLTSVALHGEAVFVADYGNRVIHKYDRTGRKLATIDGKAPSAKAAHFSIPSPFFDVAIDPCGQLIAANTGKHRLETFSTDGEFKGQWGRFGMDIEGFCGCCNPANFAILPDGSVVTAEKGLTRVKVYEASGKFVGVVAPPSAFKRHDDLCESNLELADRSALDVAVDSQGRVLVLDPLTAELRVFVRKINRKAP